MCIWTAFRYQRLNHFCHAHQMNSIEYSIQAILLLYWIGRTAVSWTCMRSSFSNWIQRVKSAVWCDDEYSMMIYRLNKIYTILSGCCFTCRQLKQLIKRQQFLHSKAFRGDKNIDTITTIPIVITHSSNNNKNCIDSKAREKKKVGAHQQHQHIVTKLYRFNVEHESQVSFFLPSMFRLHVLLSIRARDIVRQSNGMIQNVSTKFTICIYEMNDFNSNVFRGANFL